MGRGLWMVVVVSLVLAIFTARPAKGTDETMKVFLLRGQSTMAVQAYNHGGAETTNTKVPTLIYDTLTAFCIPLVSGDEQKQIAAAPYDIERKVDVDESKKPALQDLFKTTLNKLMTGDIRVADLDIGVKEVAV